jgi:hypothetical protein
MGAITSVCCDREPLKSKAREPLPTFIKEKIESSSVKEQPLLKPVHKDLLN